MGSTFLALNLQFGGFFQNFRKIFQPPIAAKPLLAGEAASKEYGTDIHRSDFFNM